MEPTTDRIVRVLHDGPRKKSVLLGLGAEGEAALEVLLEAGLVRKRGRTSGITYALTAQGKKRAAQLLTPAAAAPPEAARDAAQGQPLASKTADGRLVLCYVGEPRSPIVLPACFAEELGNLLLGDADCPI